MSQEGASMQDRSKEIDFLLVGGGLASGTAADTLRLEGAEGSVVIAGLCGR